MDEITPERHDIEFLYRTESRRILATLIRLLGDFDLAEEALHDAFAAAIEHWPASGLPTHPRAWLISTGRFKAIDRLRRRARFDQWAGAVAAELQVDAGADPTWGSEEIEDDRLRLIFTCCHPALQPDAQVALTLRTVCDVTTEEIAHAFLVSPTTLAQRIVRAKAKIRDARIPYEVPTQAQLRERLDVVLHVVYLVFNEGYSASSGSDATRPDLSGEAIRLGRLLQALLPDAETQGLLALMLLHEARRPARVSSDGEIVLLDDQDRSLWDQEMIAEGRAHLEESLRTPGFGVFALQAAIAALHAEATSIETTDWPQIVGLYDALLARTSSPVVELNRAAAVSMTEGPTAGLELIDAILARGDLQDYQPAHAARAHLLERLGRRSDAREAFTQALSLTRQEPERRVLQRRIDRIETESVPPTR